MYDVKKNFFLFFTKIKLKGKINEVSNEICKTTSIFIIVFSLSILNVTGAILLLLLVTKALLCQNVGQLVYCFLWIFLLYTSEHSQAYLHSFSFFF